MYQPSAATAAATAGRWAVITVSDNGKGKAHITIRSASDHILKSVDCRDERRALEIAADWRAEVVETEVISWVW